MKAAIIAASFLAASAAEARPALNHVYVVLDQATFDAMRDDPRVTELLGPSDAGLPDHAPPRPDADRIFLRGRTTYLEVFAPKNRFEEPVGKVGIAIAEDRPREFEQLARRWRIHCATSFYRTAVAWTRSQPQIPWYDSIQCDETAVRNDLSIWAMIYKPAFGRWHTGSPTTSRRTILAPRRTAGQGRFDLTGLDLSIPAADQRRIAQQLTAAGLRPEYRGDRIVLRGGGWSITLRSANTTSAAITTIRMRVRTTQKSTLRLGNRLLESGLREAALTF
ncbi:DUF5829 family protein [uncultured Sphingomonas sp.]|uniref:DUF5829 family protein n=1 Tax=uncultured Sphingomonas sp. TaxID=158754 RepID=UPI0025ED7C8B|nr:DUF5829 family protein [uncultured Sphingomonas sp.]